MAMTALALSLREGGDIVLFGTYDAAAAKTLDPATYWNKRFSCAPAHPKGLIVCCANQCAGVYAVYRISFVLCLLFAFLMLCTIGNNKFSARAHRGFWFLKLFTVLVLLFCTIFIQNDAMSAYRDFTRVASGFFLAVQTLLLIDFGYTMNEWLLSLDEKYEVESTYCNFKALILFLAFGLYAVSITLWALTGHWFGGDGCVWNQVTLSFSIIISVFLSIVSCTRIAPHGTLLTSAIITAYTSYLTYSALASRPADVVGANGELRCNPFDKTSGKYSWGDIFMGIVVYTISMGYTAASASQVKGADVIGKSSTAAGVANDDLTVTLENGATTSDGKEKDSAAEDEGVGAEQWWQYHLMMVVSACYMSMLCSDWSNSPWTEDSAPLNVSKESFGVKITSGFICLIMYGWTLLAPYLLRNYRDFGIEFDD